MHVGLCFLMCSYVKCPKLDCKLYSFSISSSRGSYRQKLASDKDAATADPSRVLVIRLSVGIVLHGSSAQQVSCLGGAATIDALREGFL
jgi:hypothetical protein